MLNEPLDCALHVRVIRAEREYFEVRGLSDIRKNSFPDTFEAFAPDGSLVWDLTITWDELEAAEYLIVMTEE